MILNTHRIAPAAALLALLTAAPAVAGGRPTEGGNKPPSRFSSSAPAGRHVTGVHTRGVVVAGSPYWPYPYWGWGFGIGWGWPYYPAYPYGPPYPVTVQPAEAPDAGALELHVHPWKAQVKIDGYEVGQARDFNSYYAPLVVRPGHHILELSAPDHQTLRTPIKIDRGGYYVLRYRLEEGSGVDPRSTREAAPAPPSATAPPDERGRGVTPPPATSRPPQTEGDQGPPAADEPRGLLHLRVEPSDAVVYLDGKLLGSGDELARLHGDLAIAVGTHTIEAVRPGYKSRTTSIEVGERKTVSLTLRLDPAGRDL